MKFFDFATYILKSHVESRFVYIHQNQTNITTCKVNSNLNTSILNKLDIFYF
jgi:hypothetical protein